jgi:transcriptional regulator with XRE-family HTH domain
MVSGNQIRNARNLLGWTMRQLAQRANVGMFTIDQIERSTTVSGFPGLIGILAILEAEGIEFIASDTSGVRLRPKL